MLSKNYKKILEDLEHIRDNPPNGVKYLFVFGSVAKRCIKDTSDIDLLLIGTVKKTIQLRVQITKYFEEMNLNKEIDYVYYDIETFNEIRGNNIFIQSLSEHAKTLDDMIRKLKEEM